MTSSLRQVASSYPPIQEGANQVATKFAAAFTLFGKCHRWYNSSRYMSDKDIDKLGNYIK